MEGVIGKVIQQFVGSAAQKYRGYIIGGAASGWVAIAGAEIGGGDFFYPAVALAAAYAVWTQRENPLEAYAAGAAIYAYAAKRELDKIKPSPA